MLRVPEQIKIAMMLAALCAMVFFYGVSVGEYGERSRRAHLDARKILREIEGAFTGGEHDPRQDKSQGRTSSRTRHPSGQAPDRSGATEGETE